VRQHILESRTGLPHSVPWTHCSRGHEMSGDNLYVSPKGDRQCVACQRIRRAHYMKDPQHVERQREAVRRYQSRNRNRIREVQRHRYATDPEFKARMKAHDRKRREKDRQANGAGA
jgi:hypothetical protein